MSLGLFSNFCSISEEIVVPSGLQKRLKNILKRFTALEEISLPVALLKPKRFFQAIEPRFSHLTYLDLQHVSQTESVDLLTAFASAENLKELTWNRAEVEVLNALPSPHRITKLRVKIISTDVLTLGVEISRTLAMFQGVQKLSVGICVLEQDEDNIDDLKEYFSCIWSKSSIYDPSEFEETEDFEPAPTQNDREADYLIQAFPNLTSLALQWIPNKFLSVLQKRVKVLDRLEELSFGSADDLCESAYNAAEVPKMDSVFSMAVEKTEEKRLPLFPLKKLQLCLRFDNTSVVSTHLHKIFDGIAVLFPYLEDLGVVCRIPPRLGTDVLQKWFSFKPEKFQERGMLSHLTKMQLHLRVGCCHLQGLHNYIPRAVHDLSFSIDYVHDGEPPQNREIVQFIENIGDVEVFDSLLNLHVQVTGVYAFDQLLHSICCYHPTLHEMSILSPTSLVKMDRVLEKIKEKTNQMEYLKRLRFSPSFLEAFLLNHPKFAEMAKANWQLALRELADELEVEKVEIGDLPEGLLGVRVDHHSAGGNPPELLFPRAINEQRTHINEESFATMLYEEKFSNMDHFLDKFRGFKCGKLKEAENEERVEALVERYDARKFQEQLEEYKEAAYTDDSENSFVVSDEDDIQESSEDELDKAERLLKAESRRKREQRAQKGLPKRNRKISSSSEEEIEECDDDLVINELHANPDVSDGEGEIEYNEMVDHEAEEASGIESEPESEVYFIDSEDDDHEDEIETAKEKKPKKRIIESEEEDD
ncbi:hypothetical protein L596_014036 [Steinernema carpocapsae]|uniref:Uncharacterized protein n=1 Tax=Steinernema carpocapsae TaxID=34508 RepID=A0A4U5NBI1_STECR|nr:hypothetical protein L596_014036 [Steinernema carpocapsae]